MAFVFKDDLFDAQWLRTAGHASSGGADVGECFAAARATREVDAESWFAAWSGIAERLLADAERCRAQGRRVSAISTYLRASNYFRAAYTFLIGTPVDARVVDSYRLQRNAFRAAATLMEPPAEDIGIPYEDRTLHGYFFSPPGAEGPRPTLIVNGGYDSTAEESWFFSGAAAVARGYNCILLDGPGQGGAIVEDGMVFRPDWEAVITPVVDYLVSRPEVDPDRIALIGISFGGYLATRAATGEPRLAALIADPGEYSLFEEMKGRLPGLMLHEITEGKGLALGVVRGLLEKRLRHVTAGWGLRRGLWVHGVDDPVAYLRLLQDYSNEGRVENIRCPTLICDAENDEIGQTAQKLYDGLDCPKTLIHFKSAEGAGEHCESGARMLFNQRMFDWLDEVLAGSR